MCSTVLACVFNPLNWISRLNLNMENNILKGPVFLMSVPEWDSCVDTAISRTETHTLVLFLQAKQLFLKNVSGGKKTIDKAWLTLSVGYEPAQGVCPSPHRGFYIGYTGSPVHSHQLNSVDTSKLLAHWEKDRRRSEHMLYIMSLSILFLNSIYWPSTWVTAEHY